MGRNLLPPRMALMKDQFTFICPDTSQIAIVLSRVIYVSGFEGDLYCGRHIHHGLLRIHKEVDRGCFTSSMTRYIIPNILFR